MDRATRMVQETEVGAPMFVSQLNVCEGQDHEHWRRSPTRGAAAACATLEARLIAAPDRLCDEIFKDTASGKSLAGRPQLRKALDSLAPGDELVIAEWDRVYPVDGGRPADPEGDHRRGGHHLCSTAPTSI